MSYEPDIPISIHDATAPGPDGAPDELVRVYRPARGAGRRTTSTGAAKVANSATVSPTSSHPWRPSHRSAGGAATQTCSCWKSRTPPRRARCRAPACAHGKNPRPPRTRGDVPCQTPARQHPVAPQPDAWSRTVQSPLTSAPTTPTNHSLQTTEAAAQRHYSSPPRSPAPIQRTAAGAHPLGCPWSVVGTSRCLLR